MQESEAKKKDGIPVQNRITLTEILKPARDQGSMILSERKILLYSGIYIDAPE